MEFCAHLDGQGEIQLAKNGIVGRGNSALAGSCMQVLVSMDRNKHSSSNSGTSSMLDRCAA